MEPRETIDPELHMLRSAVRLCENAKAQQEMEAARFNVYVAFEQRNQDAARRWLAALMLSCRAANELDPVRKDLREALARIAQAIEGDA